MGQDVREAKMHSWHPFLVLKPREFRPRKDTISMIRDQNTSGKRITTYLSEASEKKIAFELLWCEMNRRWRIDVSVRNIGQRNRFRDNCILKRGILNFNGVSSLV